MRAPGTRIVTVPEPAESGRHRGLAYDLYRPARAAVGAVLVLHGAGSAKESHADFARVCAAHDLAALCFDQRGHGASDGPMDERALDDVAVMADLLRDRCGPDLPIGLRGSSMGGYFALVAAAPAHARAVVAICPASGQMLVRGLEQRRFTFDADADALTGLLARHDALDAAAASRARLLLLHARGDLQVPVEHSEAIHAAVPGSRLIAVPGGHHRSIQHDPEMLAVSVLWLRGALAAAFGVNAEAGP